MKYKLNNLKYDCSLKTHYDANRSPIFEIMKFEKIRQNTKTTNATYETVEEPTEERRKVSC